MIDTSVAQIVGVAGFALAFAAIAIGVAARLAGRRGRGDAAARTWWCALVGFAAAVVACAPVGGIPVAGYFRGVLGDLSITSQLLLAAAVVRTPSGLHALGERGWTAIRHWSVGAGLVLYPLTLGLTRMDPYELGFRPRGLVLVVAALSIWCWWSRRRGAAVVLAAAVTAFHLRLLESGNLWDYVLDPYLFAYATADLAMRSRAGERIRVLAGSALGRARWQTAPAAFRPPPDVRGAAEGEPSQKNPDGFPVGNRR